MPGKRPGIALRMLRNPWSDLSATRSSPEAFSVFSCSGRHLPANAFRPDFYKGIQVGILPRYSGFTFDAGKDSQKKTCAAESNPLKAGQNALRLPALTL